MNRDDMMLVETRQPHDCRATHRTYVPGQRYVITRHKAEARQKSGLVAILRLADGAVSAKAVGVAPENKAIRSAPENKTLEANSRRDLMQLADGMGLKVANNATKAQIVGVILDERARLAAIEKESALDADAVKGGAVTE